MIVVDASVVFDALVRISSANHVRNRIFGDGEILHAPHLLDVEVMQVIRRHALIGEIDDRRSYEAVSHLAMMPLRRYPHDDLLPRIWQLRHNLTAYDATYVALAEALGVPLVTRDARMAASAGHHATIELI